MDTPTEEAVKSEPVSEWGEFPQFGMGRLGVQGQAAPEVWNAVLGA